MITFIPYKMGSSGVRGIREYFEQQLDFNNYNRIKQDRFNYQRYMSSFGGSKFKNLIVCWGNIPTLSQTYADAINNNANKNKILNANAVYATNKKIFFETLKNNNFAYLPLYTTNKSQAASWLTVPNTKVLCRTKLAAHSGDGIVVASSPEQLVNAQLYVYYVKKKSEYRAHINKFNSTIYWQEKRLRAGYDSENPNVHTIRNHDNGWVYCVSNVNPPAAVVNAVNALRNNPGYTLDFSAVDIIYNQQQNKAYVLEANTAPGLCGGTVAHYAHLFIDWHAAVQAS